MTDKQRSKTTDPALDPEVQRKPAAWKKRCCKRQLLTIAAIASPSISAFIVMYFITVTARYYEAAWLDYLEKNQEPIIMTMLVSSMVMLPAVSIFGTIFNKFAAGLQPAIITLMYIQTVYDAATSLSLVLACAVVLPMVAITALNIKEIENHRNKKDNENQR